MTAFSKIKSVSWARRPAQTDAPAGLTRRQLARREGMLADARDLLAHGLPGPGESFHGLMTGRYDLTSLLVVMLEMVPAVCSHLRIATLSFNARNTYDLRTLLESGKVERVTLLASHFFREHNPAEYAQARTMLADHPGSRIAAARSHAKVVTMDFADGQRLVTEGSANLRTNSNQEQVTLFNDAGLHDFHAAWIGATVDRHAAETSD